MYLRKLQNGLFELQTSCQRYPGAIDRKRGRSSRKRELIVPRRPDVPRMPSLNRFEFWN